MRAIHYYFLLLWITLSCQPENITPNKPVSNNQIDLTNAMLVKQGTLTGIGGHTASGMVEVYELNNKKYIVFDPYSSQSGPDLKVYLSKDEKASEYIRVGPLQSTTGKQIYEVPGNPDLALYSFVHIWCERYSVEFARSQLL